MGRYNLGLYFIAFLLLFSVSSIVNAQYWYQYGVRAGSTSNQNSGAAITIQTVTPQLSNSGSLGYWVGENLDNGAFLQVGYVIENQSGKYPSLCDRSGCSNYEEINAGDAQWFYEYFPSGYNGGFLGALGVDGSAGANNTFHTYSFYVSGNKWYFKVDGNVVGNVSLGTTSSGVGIPVAFGEVANTTGVVSDISKILFSNFSVYQSGGFRQVQEGLSYIGYGVGSQTDKLNPYGVSEVNNRINYFEVGSNLPQPKNNTMLWSLGYGLKIISQYGNLSGNINYVAYSNVGISSPAYVQLNSTTRMKFIGWQGVGLGSYSGPLNSTQITMNSNVTETALWQKQYYFNASSQYGGVIGAGWYNANSTVNYAISSNITQTSATSREKFEGWSNGNVEANGTTVLTKPITISANWKVQYLVNLQTQYENVSGNGWYYNGSIAKISLIGKPISLGNNTQLGFYQWSDGNMNQTRSVLISQPVILSTEFRQMYIANFQAQNTQGGKLGQIILYLQNGQITNNSYFFSNVNYQITSAYYKGVKMNIAYNFSINSPQIVAVTLPVYNVNISSRDIFGLPINSSISLNFSNGTQMNTYTGPTGSTIFQNVPYGYATGSITYLGITQQIMASDGTNPQVYFVSVLNIGLFGMVAVIIAIAYFSAKRHFRKVGYEEEISQGS